MHIYRVLPLLIFSFTIQINSSDSEVSTFQNWIVTVENSTHHPNYINANLYHAHTDKYSLDYLHNLSYRHTNFAYLKEIQDNLDFWIVTVKNDIQERTETEAIDIDESVNYSLKLSLLITAASWIVGKVVYKANLFQPTLTTLANSIAGISIFTAAVCGLISLSSVSSSDYIEHDRRILEKLIEARNYNQS